VASYVTFTCLGVHTTEILVLSSPLADDLESLVDHFLQQLPENVVRAFSERSKIHLAHDFVCQFPPEITDKIFSYLSGKDALNASLTSRLAKSDSPTELVARFMQKE